MAGLDELIGNKISLISQQDIRYEGTLQSINAKESSIILRAVTCFGTEDRVTEADKQVAATKEKVLPFVKFPGSEIKDLFVHEDGAAGAEDADKSLPAAPAAAPKANAAPPAPPKQTQDAGEHKPRRNNNSNYNDREGRPAWADRPQGDRNRDRDGQQGRGRGQGRNSNSNYNNRDRERGENNGRPQRQNNHAGGAQPAAAAGTGLHLLHLRERQNAPGAGATGGDADASTTAAEIKKTEFDFQAALTSFKKVTVDSSKAGGEGGATYGTAEAPPVPVPEVKPYVKDDFFDTFSATDKTQDGPRYNGAAEKNLNKDTFGATSLQSNYRRYNNRGYNNGGGRGYNSGGRGRGGRGRGQYNNNGGGSSNA